MGPQRVISLPDAVAGALVEHYLTQSVSQQLDLPMGNDNENNTPAQLPQANATPASWQPVELSSDGHSHANGNGHVTSTGYKTRADICPSCGTVSLIRIEGCEKCDVCGYSRC
jgi:ribonucleoside-diphosphate reductase alpha chain